MQTDLNNIVKAFKEVLKTCATTEEAVNYFIETTDGKKFPQEILSSLVQALSERTTQINQDSESWYDELTKIN